MRPITSLLTALLALLLLAVPLAAAEDAPEKESADNETATYDNESVDDEPKEYGEAWVKDCPPDHMCAYGDGEQTADEGNPEPCIECSGPPSDQTPTRTDSNCMDGSADDCNWDYRYLDGPPTDEMAQADGTDDGRVYKGETDATSAKSVPAFGVLVGALGLMGAALLVARRK